MTKYNIEVEALAKYIDSHSDPDDDRYVFAYTITIHNAGTIAVQLLTRHWLITDSHEKVQEVKGEGVVGKTPYLKPGESFQYTSAAVIETAVGKMEGSYQMLADDGMEFDAPILAFSLSIPRTLH